jgi:phosphatidylserine decarboxylase
MTNPKYSILKIKIVAIIQTLLPHHFLSSFVHFIMRIKQPGFKNFVIRNFVKLYNVDMTLANKENIEDYLHFNDFFTRTLKTESRPVDTDEKSIICPVDGTISQIGKIENGKIIQAKGSMFDANTLLGKLQTSTCPFEAGSFATIYLSPRDYHRIHMPCDGNLIEMNHIPGRLFSVSNLSVAAIPELFARNERITPTFSGPVGKFSVVMVGAIFVSSMETTWQGVITPPNGKWMKMFRYPEGKNQLNKADEMGRFNMGSTVILLFEKGAIQWREDLTPGTTVCFGEQIGQQTK